MAAMTEEEARKKWCPASFAIPEQRLPNGDGGREAGPWMCIASGCMAWRWESKAKAGDDRVRAVKERRTTAACSIMEAVAWVDANDRVTTGVGYCGLAGVPTP